MRLSSPLTRIRAHPVITVFVLALVARALCLALMWPERGWREPGIRYGAELGRIAANLAEGRGYSSPFGTGTTPSAWFTPLVPLLWAGIFRLAGTHSEASLVLVYALQVLASSLACAFYVRAVAEEWEGRARRTTAVIACGLLVVFWPSSLAQMRKPWYSPMQDCCVAALLLSGRRWMTVPGRRQAITLGVVGGVTALVNPTPLPLLIWFLVGALGRRTRLTPVLASFCVAAAVVAVMLLPWRLRNERVLGAPLWTRSNFGVELQQGNHPEGTARQTSASVHPMLRSDEMALFRSLGEVRYSQQASEKALSYIIDSPWTFAKRTLERFYLYWCDDVFDQWPWRPAAPWWHLPLPFLALRLSMIVLKLLPALALPALVRLGAAPGRAPGAFLFAGVLLLLPMPAYVTHVNEGYAQGVVPALLLWNASALVMWRGRGNRDALRS